MHRKSLNRLFRREVQSLEIGLQNFLVNSLPDSWLCGRVLRPALIRWLGMKCGPGVFLRRGSYYGQLKNISLGTGCCINREVFFDAYDRITLGDNVGVGFRAVLVTSTHQMGDSLARVGPLMGQPITIGPGVWIGAGATIGPGVSIGSGSVVASGAVVLRNVPADCVVAGSPARVIMRLDQKKSKNVVEQTPADADPVLVEV